MEYNAEEREHMGNVNCSKVKVEKGKYGWGVFARDNYAQGEILETGLMTRLVNVNGHENPHLFTWSDDRTIWASASGCIPFYNHSKIANVKKIGDLKNDTMTIVALRDINKDDELFNHYYSRSWRTCFEHLDD